MAVNESSMLLPSHGGPPSSSSSLSLAATAAAAASNDKSSGMSNPGHLQTVFHVLIGITIGMVIIVVKDRMMMHGESHAASSKASSSSWAIPHVKNGAPATKYSQLQTLGFQIYTGGAPAFLTTNETAAKARIIDDIPIDPADESTYKNPECTGRHAYGVLGGWEYMCYTGNDDPIADVQARFAILEQAVERAYEVSESDDPSVLKVFLVPEFFWRGIHGAYELFDSSNSNKEQEEGSNKDDCNAICHMLQLLEGLVADDRFDDWVFLFGTVIASEKLESNGIDAKSMDESDDDYLFYNFAPIYRGGRRSNSRFLLPKRYVSKIDFLTPQRDWSESLAKELVDEPLPEETDDAKNGPTPPMLTSVLPSGNSSTLGNSYHHHHHSKKHTISNPITQNQVRYDNENLIRKWREYKHRLSGGNSSYTFIEYGWIVLDGISMTIEICYDHKRRTALESYLADVVTGSTTRIPSYNSTIDAISYVSIPVQQAQVSLVSSAGMQIHPDALTLTDGGTIFLQDGLTDLNTMIIVGDVDNGETTTMTSTSKAFSSSSSSLAFDGGSEAVTRRAVLAPNDVFFEHAINNKFVKHSVYTESAGAWVDAVKGTFSVNSYEPMITAYAPIPIVSNKRGV